MAHRPNRLPALSLALAAALLLAACTSAPRKDVDALSAPEAGQISAQCTHILDTPAAPNPYYRFLITEPGYYCLAQDLELSPDAPETALIAIIFEGPEPYVTLDLQGHTLQGPKRGSAVKTHGITILGSDVTVRNGHLRGFEHAVLVTSGLGRDYERPQRDSLSGRIELSDHGMVFENLRFSANRHSFTLNAVRDERTGQSIILAYMLSEFVQGISQCSAQHSELADHQGAPLRLAFEAFAPSSELAQRDPNERRFYLRAMNTDAFRLTLSSLQMLGFISGEKVSPSMCEKLARSARSLDGR